MNRRELMSLAVPLMAAAYFAPSLVFAQEAARDPYAPTEVAIREDFEVGSIVVVSKDFFLYHVIAPGRAVRYGVAVGREGLGWRGQAVIGRKVEWPSWRPTDDMIARSPERYAKYADGMPGGPENPLGARALYFFQGERDTAIRVHGTLDPSSIGHQASNGCFRMYNSHVIDLYNRVPLGSRAFAY